MKYYNCVVAVEADISGRPLMTVHKEHLSEYELKLLRGIHGHDRVIEVKPAGEVAADEEAVRLEHLRLARRYGDGGGFNDGNSHGVLMVARHLGVELHEYENWLAETQEAEEQERQARVQERQERFNNDQAARSVVEALTTIAQRATAPPPLPQAKKAGRAPVE